MRLLALATRVSPPGKARASPRPFWTANTLRSTCRSSKEPLASSNIKCREKSRVSWAM